ncbi:sugar transferase [Vibrio alginolyticus]|uniref:sugar transferase n=1 Tax=Vibrio TaxID=662 RepID=UPI001BD68ED8|nr:MULTISPECIES: sugar transferase [Vibrio]ELA6780359.1 sugar transferase [Vibrio alginolyticus]EMB9225347.1 sugar transferase [Vibrio alginolyticus]MBT0029168.1 sugar transferase [Vibrio alginolyticus]MDW1656889.1 sugar transferase [Vibrio sp. Vb2658]
MKRIIDVLTSLVAMVILSPVFCLLYFLIKIKLGSPVFFSQLRPGKDEKIFRMYKFRTMTDCRDENGHLLPDSERITQFGAFLRKSSLDELPSLWNILKGDMSLVGPRPLLVEYLDYYTDEEKRRHKVRPGLTGLAQVSGRNNLGWDERLNIDIQYVNNPSLLLDIKILIKTFYKVIKKDDVVVVPSTKFGKLSEERNECK